MPLADYGSVCRQFWSQYLLAASFVNFIHYCSPSSGFYGAGKDNRGRRTDFPSGCHPIWTIGVPESLIPRFLPNALSDTHIHTHPFNGPLSGTTQVSWYQKGKTNLDFTEARDSERQWHQLGHMQVCTLLQTDNHASTPPLSFLQAGCPSCRPTNSVKALKAVALKALSDTTLLIYLGFGQALNNAGLHTQWLGWLLIKFYAYIVHIYGLSVNVHM